MRIPPARIIRGSLTVIRARPICSGRDGRGGGDIALPDILGERPLDEFGRDRICSEEVPRASRIESQLAAQSCRC